MILLITVMAVQDFSILFLFIWGLVDSFLFDCNWSGKNCLVSSISWFVLSHSLKLRPDLFLEVFKDTHFSVSICTWSESTNDSYSLGRVFSTLVIMSSSKIFMLKSSFILLYSLSRVLMNNSGSSLFLIFNDLYSNLISHRADWELDSNFSFSFLKDVLKQPWGWSFDLAMTNIEKKTVSSIDNIRS